MNPDATAADVPAVLTQVTAGLPGHEDRPGQVRMAELVAEAIRHKKHLIVQAGTGTGKTLAYLVGSILQGKRLVVATATKALQDQLATKDLPYLEQRLGATFSWALLKGRSNYLCLQRLHELSAPGAGQLELEGMTTSTRSEIARLAAWAATTHTGDGAELDWSPSDAAWSAVSVGSEECPGAKRCPLGASCFAEAARRRAADADVIVVNTHLYGLDVGSGGAILPEHDVVVIDEAHQLEDTMSDTVGISLTPGRFARVGAAVRKAIDDPRLVGAITAAAGAFTDALSGHTGRRLGSSLPAEIVDALGDGRRHCDAAMEVLRRIETTVEDARQRVLRAQQLTTRLVDEIDAASTYGPSSVAFVAGSPERPRLEIAPLDVGPVLAAAVWSQRTAVLTSATIPRSLAERVGLPAGGFDDEDVGSPFDYAANALLYCPLHLPDPRDTGFTAAAHDELGALITAAGGRTLALFTSYRAMDAAAAALRERLPFPILTQRDRPKTALVDAFRADEATCIFATSGFFQGIDVPGRTLSLVTIDRIPFPRPDDPLLAARREHLGADAFRVIDLPRATMLLAQAAGRLVRTRSDRGVVAVLDRRLGTAGYRWDIVRALPPMRRTRQRAEAEAFLREITS